MIGTATLQGTSALSNAITTKITAARAGLKTGVAAAAQLFIDEAKSLVPVETGNLRDNIHAEQVTDEESVQSIAVSPVTESGNEYGFDPAYARRIEYGFVGQDSLGRHYNQAAQPYMRPAYDTQREAAQAAVGAAIAGEMGA